MASTETALAPVDPVALALGAVAGGEPANDGETWRPVVGYEGRYEVSDAGRVRNARTGRVLRRYLGTHGYLHVCLPRNEGGQRTIKVHTLVLDAFVGARPAGFEASHLNHDRVDNRLVNLRWETHAQNMERSAASGRLSPPPPTRGESHRDAKLTAADVVEIRAAHAAGCGYRSLARRYGVNRTTIRRVGRRLTWRHV